MQNNTDNHYVDVDPRWRWGNWIDEYYHLLGINKHYGVGYTFKLFLIAQRVAKLSMLKE